MEWGSELLSKVDLYLGTPGKCEDPKKDEGVPFVNQKKGQFFANVTGQGHTNNNMQQKFHQKFRFPHGIPLSNFNESSYSRVALHKGDSMMGIVMDCWKTLP